MNETQPDMMSMMKSCMAGCRWCALMPIVFGIALFLIGYLLDPETVRILWLIASGFMVFMGVICLVMMAVFKKS